MSKNKTFILILVLFYLINLAFYPQKEVLAQAQTSVQPSMTSCQFVELLISIDVIADNLANRGRSALGCSPSNTANLIPKVDLKINGSNGPVMISGPRSVTISWTSANVTSCFSQNNKPTSGTQSVFIDRTRNIGITCTGPHGTTTDSVQIIIQNNNREEANNDNITTNNDPELAVSCSGYSPTVYLDSPMYWIAIPVGGNGNYNYSWSGTENLSGSGQYISKNYSTVGTKSATVQVTSGKQVVSAGCSVIVSAVPASAAPANTKTTNDTSSVFKNSSFFTPITPAGPKKVLSLQGRMGDYVSVSNSPSLSVSNQITLEAWVKPNGWVRANKEAEGISTILVKGQIAEGWDYWFGLDNGKIYYTSGSHGTPVRTCNAVVPLNVWSHVAVSINGSAISMYLNGNKIDSLCGGVSSVGISQSNKNLYIGNIYPKYCSASWFNFGFKGLMDDVRIWNTARTASEILASTKTVSSNLNNSNLIARWTFDSGYPMDVTGNGNNGSMIGVNTGVVPGAPTIISHSESPSESFVGNIFNENTYVNDNACEVASDEIKVPGPVTYVEISGVITGKAKCVNQDGGSSQYTGVTISPCSGTPVVNRVYNLDPSGAPSSSGNNQSGITQGYSAPILALWVARYGAEPHVGDSIIGTLQSPKTEVGTFCWTGKPGTETGDFISGSEGAKIGGWLTTGGYGLSANSCSTATTTSSTNTNNDGMNWEEIIRAFISPSGSSGLIMNYSNNNW